MKREKKEEKKSKKEKNSLRSLPPFLKKDFSIKPSIKLAHYLKKKRTLKSTNVEEGE